MNGAALSALHELASITTDGKLAHALAALGLPRTGRDAHSQAVREAVLFWRLYMRAGGPDLDPAIWKPGQNTRLALAEAIEAALLDETDPGTALGHLIHTSGLAPDVLQANLDTPGTLNYDWQEELLELFKTEVSRCHLAVQVLKGDVPLSRFQEHKQREPVVFNNGYISRYTQL